MSKFAESGCPHCRGREWIQYEKNGCGYARKCECHPALQAGKPPKSEDVLKKRLHMAGLTEAEIEDGLAPWDKSAAPLPTKVVSWGKEVAVYEARCKAEHQAWPPREVPNQLVLLHGRNGRGKTKSAVLTVAEYLNNGGQDAMFVSMGDVLSVVMRERKESGQSELEARILNCRFLVLDDVGSEAAKHAGVVEEWLLSRERRGGAFTLLTTNLRPVDIGGPRVQSRLLRAHIVEMSKGTDYRGKH